MRMWMVDPKIMCRKHLLGEHVETHMFLGSLLKRKSMVGYVEAGITEFSRLKERHDELAEEMLSRGYNHRSPMPEEKVLEGVRLLSNWMLAAVVDRSVSEKELVGRCVDCRRLAESRSVK